MLYIAFLLLLLYTKIYNVYRYLHIYTTIYYKKRNLKFSAKLFRNILKTQTVGGIRSAFQVRVLRGQNAFKMKYVNITKAAERYCRTL